MRRRDLFPLLLAGVAKGAERPPNVVIILADDLGYGDLGIYGHPTIRTPHLDTMAGEGVRFTSFYSFPMCTPTRAALLTGRYPIRSGLTRVLHPGENFGLPETEVTLPGVLKEHGYATACIGKWHLGDRRRYRPNRHGFDYYYGLLYSNDMHRTPPNFRRLRLFRNEEPIEYPVNQSTLTQRYTQESVQFIERNRDNPFFLYLPHTMPHIPLHASPGFRGRSRRGLYGDVVEEIDHSTGEILTTIRKLGLDNNTLVIFTSDNGPTGWAGPDGGTAGTLRGSKGMTWEGGVRVPFIARWPGQIPAGTVRPGIATVMDLFTTSVELARARVPGDRPIDGKNILPMMTGEASPHPEFYYYFRQRIFAVRSGDWKLHFFQRQVGPRGRGNSEPCDPPELYHLGEDPGEEFNVAAVHPEIVSRLTALAREFEQSVEPGKLPPRLIPRLPKIRP